MPDFRLQPTFPVASVIDAAQRKAALENQAAVQQHELFNQSMQAIGQVGQSLVEKRNRVAQSLALGKILNLPKEVDARILTPDQLINYAKSQKGYEDQNTFIDTMAKINRILNPGANPPTISEAPATPGMVPVAGTPNPSPAHQAGAILAHQVSGTPIPEPSPVAPPAINGGGLTPPTTGVMPAPVPMMVPPVQAPAATAPSQASPRISPAIQKMITKMVEDNQPHDVTQYVPGKGLVSVGTKRKGDQVILNQSNGGSGSVSMIGNTPDGKPLLLAKDGTISIGKVPGDVSVLPKSSTQPTAATRTTSEFAKTIIPHIDSMRNLVNQADAKGYIGPGAGRIYGEFLAGKVGSTGNEEADRILGRLRSTDSLLKTGAMKVHFGSRGGTQMYDHFSDMLNSGKQSKAMLNASLDGIQEFMEGYAGAGSPGGKYVPPTSSSSQHSEAIQWAQSHPQDPRSAAILDKAMKAVQGAGGQIGL